MTRQSFQDSRHQDISGLHQTTSNKQNSAFAMQLRTFIGLLVLATALPYFAVPLLNLAPNVTTLAELLVFIEFAGGGAHVAAGYYFFLEKKGRSILLAHWPRTILVPLCMALVYGIVFMKGTPALKAAALLFYFIWQTWHYQRQNFGVSSFMMRAAQQPPLTRKERLPMQMAVIAAILALVKLYNLGNGLMPSPVVQAIWLAATCLQAIAILTALAVAFSIRRQQGAARRSTVMILGTLFFLPSFLYANPINAVLSYALAHGLQYLVFMGYIGDRQERRLSSWARLIVLTLALGGLLIVMQARNGQPVQEFVFGVYLSIIMTHFVMDGIIWRLRLAPQRAYMGRIFSFVFARTT
ncbi:MAG TPA: hypothetical protein VJU59_11900 [Paraburkholderia sp.]|uniref:hypothetical protein n=1 Tax=Paraburkholderia sp. TaxID=1926495 RepID=UPI002B48DBFE|nr:hypothetical protein [Paraburkholderia sp.]HKR40361.1 hypothetical protein [Paraburkholderia sp.]